jgi:DNA mismatch repair protein MutS
LAGLPADVVRRAASVLSRLEAGEGPDGSKLKIEMPLFAQVPSVPENPSTVSISVGAKSALETIRKTEIDALTPREAMNLLYELAELVNDLEN